MHNAYFDKFPAFFDIKKKIPLNGEGRVENISLFN